MTGTGYPHSSAIRGDRRCLSLFLLAVFTPMLWPAETWASLTRPAPTASAYPFAVSVPESQVPTPRDTLILRVAITRSAAGDLAVAITEEPLCTRAAAAVWAADTGKTPIRAPDPMPKNAWAVFSNFQNAQILEVTAWCRTCFFEHVYPAFHRQVP